MEIILKIHGYWSIVVIILSIITLILTLKNFFLKENINSGLRKIALITTASFHIQMLLGVVMLFINSHIFSNITSKFGTGITYIEHLSSGFLSVLLITIYNAKIKRVEKITPIIILLIFLAVIFISRAIPLMINVLQR